MYKIILWLTEYREEANTIISIELQKSPWHHTKVYKQALSVINLWYKKAREKACEMEVSCKIVFLHIK